MSTQVECQVIYNSDQEKALKVAWNPLTTYNLFYGGGGSGKSFFLLLQILLRAMLAPGSRHICFRLTSVSCRQTLFDKTLREVLEKAFPGMLAELIRTQGINETEMSVTLPNGSVIFFNGLNDEGRMQKVLGDAFNTIWLNECNEFNYRHVSILVGRLRHVATREDGKPLKNKMWFDCNPASQKDWEYLAFELKTNPIDRNALKRPTDWVSINMRPTSNIEHLGADYLEQMESTMTASDRQRYIVGYWSSDREGAMFTNENIATNRLTRPVNAVMPHQVLALLPSEPIRTIVAVDPNASDNKDSDLTGISVQALCIHEGRDGKPEEHAYILADLSMKGRPEQWARVVAKAYSDWSADRVIAEKNMGGLMVETTLRGAYRHLPIRLVHASKGKTARAEPISALYERGLIHHVGDLHDLEQQMTEWGTLQASKSPDRMDALVWGLTDLMNLRNKGPQPVKTRTSQRLR